MNIKCVVAYDGGNYFGWQRTKEGPSIEEVLWRVLDQMRLTPLELNGASRTDKGVHARGQVVNILIPKEIANLDKLFMSLNRLLPEDIAIRDLQVVPEDFHATLHSLEKEYHYELCTARVLQPRDRHYCWHYPYPLDLGKMHLAARSLLGEHDFRALCNMRKNLAYSDYRRHIARLEIESLPEEKFLFKVSGPRFLYKMVRNLVGLIVYVGRGLIAVEEVLPILASHDRKQSGITAPAHGLTLHAVRTQER